MPSWIDHRFIATLLRHMLHVALGTFSRTYFSFPRCIACCDGKHEINADIGGVTSPSPEARWLNTFSMELWDSPC